MNQTDLIRRAMQEGVEYTADQLSGLSGVDRKRIAALLKHDIEMGRVIKNDEYPRTYRLATLAEQRAPRIESAIRLLTRCGYTVSPPNGSA